MSFIDKPIQWDMSKDDAAKSIHERFRNRQFWLEVVCETPLEGADYPKMLDVARDKARRVDVPRSSDEFLDEIRTSRPRKLCVFKGFKKGPYTWWAAIVEFGDPTIRRMLRSRVEKSEDDLVPGVEERRVYALFNGWTSRRGTEAVLVDYSGSSEIMGKTHTVTDAREFMQYMLDARVGDRVTDGYGPSFELEDIDLGSSELPRIEGLPPVVPRERKPTGRKSWEEEHRPWEDEEEDDDDMEVLSRRPRTESRSDREESSGFEEHKRRKATEDSKGSDFWGRTEPEGAPDAGVTDLEKAARNRRKSSDW